MTLEAQLNDTVNALKAFIKTKPRIGFVLGSGLANFAKRLKNASEVDFGKIPHFHSSTVEGHPGRLLFGELCGVPAVIQQGRLHAYEGLDFQQVVYPIRVMSQLGVKTVVLTNAAGGLNPKMQPGDFMVITDQINLTGDNPLRGPNPAFLGPRFVDMTEPFDPELSSELKKSMKSAKARLFEGVYVGVLGPTYETAAEIQFFRKIGGGAVGMSTVSEVIAARHCGMKVAGLSCITNLGTGLSREKLSHKDVKAVALRVESIFAAGLEHFTKTLKSKKWL